MPKRPISFEPRTSDLTRSGKVVGITDRVYQLTGSTVTFDEILVKGDLSGELAYNGTKLRVVAVDTMIGLEVGASGARGPVWKHVTCEVLN
jgi:hypothetical protein